MDDLATIIVCLGMDMPLLHLYSHKIFGQQFINQLELRATHKSHD